MTDEDFLATLETLKAHAAKRSEQAFKACDRKLFNLWDSRLSHLKYVRSYEDLHREGEELSRKIDGLVKPSGGAR